MKLFKNYQVTNKKDYDVYGAAVVAATNEDEARTMHPNGEDIVTDAKKYASTWARLKDARVIYLGEAKEGTEGGVISASYYAG